MFNIIPVLIFFGALLSILVILILVYFCVRKGECCWQKSTEDSILGGGDDFSEDDVSFFNKPYLMTKPVYHQLQNEPDFDDQDPQFYVENAKVTSIQKAKQLESVKSCATGYTSTEESDSTDKVQKKKKPVHQAFIEGNRVRLSLLYSKSDLFLMLTVNEVEGVSNKEDGGFDYVRVAITLLPKKKYHSKTKFVFINESKASFDESFKFSNVSRESLFSSAFRIRLQGKKKMGKEACVGEVVVHLADVAQRAGGFMTWRTFEEAKR